MNWIYGYLINPTFSWNDWLLTISVNPKTNSIILEMLTGDNLHLIVLCFKQIGLNSYVILLLF